MEDIFGFPWMVSGSLFVAICILFALLGLWITHKSINPKTRKNNHDVAGFTFGIVGVVYAVLLGFTVVNVNDRFNSIQKNLVEESAVMLQLYRDAETFPEATRNAIRREIKSYAELVYNEEWDMMAAQKESSQAYDRLLSLWKEYYKVDPQNDKEMAWFKESLLRMNELANYRIIRLFNTTQSLGSMMWTLLVSGALITIFFMYFFSIESLFAHALLTALLTGTISFMLFLILSLDSAFSGDVSVAPTEIEKTIQRFNS